MTLPSKFYADLAGLTSWAEGFMLARKPDFVIERDGQDYLRRWWVVPRNHFHNVYLHEILMPDDNRALHDHPWDNTSFLIDGSYIEVTFDGEVRREAGEVVHRKAINAHRLIPVTDRVISLFITGPIIREWGFHCPQGWRRWQDFVELVGDGSTSVIGRGCAD